MRHFFALLILATCIFIPIKSMATPDYALVGSISFGSAWENAGEKQTLYLTPSIEKTYTSDQSTEAVFDGEVFLGLQKILSQHIQGQLGLAVAATSSANPSGDIWDDADPSFNNFTYDYKIQHTHIAIKGKILFNPDNRWLLTPWVSTSLGVGFNHAYGFSNEPTIFEAIPSADFASNTETTFTYTIGIGIQKIFDKHWQVGTSYEFSDWGKSKLGAASGQTSGSGLTLDHIYTNAIMFNATYLL
jgi:opacity protein-like surface antigen